MAADIEHIFKNMTFGRDDGDTPLDDSGILAISRNGKNPFCALTSPP
jgi:hypothetical protein